MLKIKPWIYFSFRRVQQHSHVRRVGVVGPFSETTWSVCSFLQWWYFNVCSLLANIRYLRLCAALRFPPSFPWEDWLWKYLECTQFTGSQVGVALSLWLARNYLQPYAKGGETRLHTHTHTQQRLCLHTRALPCARAHTCTITFHMIKVCLFRSLCSVHKLARRRVSVIRTRSQYQLILP